MRTFLIEAIILIVPSILDACGSGGEAMESSKVELIERWAFVICDEDIDKDNGLTWKEVSHCIVSYILLSI